MRTARLALIGALSACLFASLGACTSGSSQQEAGADPSATVDPHALLGVDGQPLMFEEIDIASATAPAPGTFEAVGEIRTRAHGPITTLLAAGSAGLLVNTTPENTLDAGTNTLVKSGTVGIVDGSGVRAFGSTADLVAGDSARQTYVGDVDDEWATWMETPTVHIINSHWRIFAQDLSGGTPVLLARSDDALSELPMHGGEPEPVVSAGRVWWHTAYTGGDGTSRPRVVSVPADGGDVRIEQELATTPRPIAGGVVAIKRNDEAGRANRELGILRIDTAGASEDLVAFATATDDDWFVRDLAADGDLVALSMSSGLYILRTDGTPLAQVTFPSDAVVEGVEACSGRVVFTVPDSTSGLSHLQYVYDSASNELVAIKTPHNSGPTYCSADRIAWTQFVDAEDETVITESLW